MNDKNQIKSLLRSFPELGPETVLNLVEAELDIPCSNLCRQLTSYINRVFELETLDRKGLIVKFYRADRWSKQALQDEHDFLRELNAQEIPVISPLELVRGGTIAEKDGLFFSVFPYCGGRSSDEFTEDQWLEVGRLLGRTHAVGAVHPSRERMIMKPECSTRQQVDFILASGVIQDPVLASEFSLVCDELIHKITPLFRGISSNRIHGDCHFSNIIYRPGESFYIIDFDDMVMGPAVQDLWMLLPGPAKESLLEIDLFLEGYETFHPFDRRSLRLIEALRGMRFVHYIAWLSHQYLADGSAPIVPGFGLKEYWIIEIADLKDQLERIKQDDEPMGNFF
jgi:Ser/Thr protein kinase RdoA (MazF antagonist)